MVYKMKHLHVEDRIMKVRAWLALALILCLTVSLAACGSNDTAVYVQSVSNLTGMGGIAAGDRFPGMVVSENVTEIKKDSEKTVKEVLVKEGDDVNKGDKLFEYDTDELQLSLEKKQLELEQLNASIENYQQQIKELEKEIGIELFKRSSHGTVLTPEGEEFLGYARQVTDQYQLLENRYVYRTKGKKKFSVSMQHYSFAVKAFVELVKQFGMDEYEFAVYETRTYDVLMDVKNFKSELGILYRNDFNAKVLNKLMKDNNLEFHDLFSCGTYVYLWKDHPLADKTEITMEELKEYPCLSFDQGSNNSFFLAEEVLSTYEYKRIIKANDRATMLNLMVGLNGYTLCSGIICEELNGSDYRAVPLHADENMMIGYVSRKGMSISAMGLQYLEEIRKYKEFVL